MGLSAWLAGEQADSTAMLAMPRKPSAFWTQRLLGLSQIIRIVRFRFVVAIL